MRASRHCTDWLAQSWGGSAARSVDQGETSMQRDQERAQLPETDHNTLFRQSITWPHLLKARTIKWSSLASTSPSMEYEYVTVLGFLFDSYGYARGNWQPVSSRPHLHTCPKVRHNGKGLFWIYTSRSIFPSAINKRFQGPMIITMWDVFYWCF